MSSFVLRGVNADLWRRARLKASLSNVNLRAMIEQWLIDWLEGPI